MTLETSSSEQTAINQLEKLAAEFQLWRSQKKNPAESVPIPLLQEAQRLTHYFKVSVVRKRLGITKAQMDKLKAMKQVPPDQTQFMTLVPHAATETSTHKELKVKIDTPQGVSITLSGLTEKNPLGVIATLLEA